MTDVSVLCPPSDSAEEAKLRRYIARRVVFKVIVNATIHRPTSDLMEEVYLAGMWHGVKLNGPAPRKPDIIDITPAPRRRGRRRSIKDDGPTAA